MGSRGWRAAVPLVLIVAIGDCRQSSQQPQWVTGIFPTEGMTCGGCERAVQGAVGKLEGVKEVCASHQEKLTRVTYDATRVRPEQVVGAIRKLGYDAKGPAASAGPGTGRCGKTP